MRLHSMQCQDIIIFDMYIQVKRHGLLCQYTPEEPSTFAEFTAESFANLTAKYYHQ